MITLSSHILIVSKIVSPTKAEFFSELKTGDMIVITTSIKAVRRGQSGLKATYLTITNWKTTHSIKRSFTQLAGLLKHFEFTKAE